MAHSLHTNGPVSLLNGQYSSAPDAVAHLETRSILTANPSLWLNDDTQTGKGKNVKKRFISLIV